ncbi:MAG: phosphatidate cytidylyltransferase [Bacteroidota bacterium]|nr:phosphatidate cytidylyltransferase [Odoribacter sp.]MDP3642668.1 phosphatidate cytidylyltransferase [Bacteroidota bacterium]
MTQFYFLLLYIFAFLTILALSELIYKKKKISAEYTRKISHIAATLTSLSFVYAFQSHWFVLFLAIFSFLLLFIGKLNNAFKSIENVSRHTLGSYLLPVGIYISFAISDFLNDRLLFVLPVLILAISDTAAGITGTLYQKKERSFSVLGRTFDKTFAGTLTFLFSSLMISFTTFMAFGFNFPKVILLTIYISIATTITEFLSPNGSDNVTIPIVASFILAYTI